MALVAINIGLDLGLLNRELFTMLVLMALITTAMTGPLLRWWLPPAEQAAYERSLAALRAQVDAAELASAWATGRAQALEQTIAEALSGYSAAPQTPQ